MQWRATLTTSDPIQTPVLHEVIVVYNTPGFNIWIQTSQIDFEAGVLNNIDTTTSSGDVTLGVQSVPTTIAFDDFESGGWSGGSGWLWNWWDSGDASIVTNGQPHGGSRHLRLRRANGYVDRAVDLTGQTDVRLQFWAKANSFEPGETASCSIYDGSSWNTVQTWEDGDDDNTYHFYDIDLSGFAMSSEFYVAFDAEMSGNNDYPYIDDLAFIATGSQYYGSGTIASQVFDTGTAGTSWDELDWSETLQSGTDITFEVRASDTPFNKDDVSPSWIAVGGTSPVTAGLPSGRYIQWRATLTTSDLDNTPILHEVIVCYE
jgi:hypothetical protein